MTEPIKNLPCRWPPLPLPIVLSAKMIALLEAETGQREICFGRPVIQSERAPTGNPGTR